MMDNTPDLELKLKLLEKELIDLKKAMRVRDSRDIILGPGNNPDDYYRYLKISRDNFNEVCQNDLLYGDTHHVVCNCPKCTPRY